MDLDGAVVTSDALHTVRANLDWLVTDKKAHYIAIVKRNQPLLHAQVRALPWRQVPAGGSARETGHGRAETRTVKTAHVSHLKFPWARQAIKITRWRQDTGTGKASRETVYAVTSLTSAHATAQDLARLVREHWSIEAHHHIRDVTFSEDNATNRTGSGPANLATIRAAIIAAIKEAGYLHIPEGRRDHTTPPKPSAFTAWIRTEPDIHGTRRSPGSSVRPESRASITAWRACPFALLRAALTVRSLAPGSRLLNSTDTPLTRASAMRP